MNQVPCLGTACKPSFEQNTVLRGLEGSVCDAGASQGLPKPPSDPPPAFPIYLFFFFEMLTPAEAVFFLEFQRRFHFEKNANAPVESSRGGLCAEIENSFLLTQF